MTMRNLLSGTASWVWRTRTRILEWNERCRILGDDAKFDGDGTRLLCVLFSCAMTLELALTPFFCEKSPLLAIPGMAIGFLALLLFVAAYVLITRERPHPAPDTFRYGAWLVGIGSVLALAELLVQTLMTSAGMGVSGALPFLFVLFFREDFGPAYRSSETPRGP